METRTELIKDESGVYVDREMVYTPLWYHRQGLQQTASGYGGKLNTGYKMMYAGKLRRVYCMCYSNSGTNYVLVNGARRVI